jgi:hypothetical protein
MRCGEAAAPPGAIENGRILDSAALGLALRHLIARTEINTTRALIAASDTVASCRVLTFPKTVTEAEVDAAVRTELNLGSERMSSRHVDVLTGRDERTVFAAVWDRGQVQAIANATKLAGLDPAVVDLKSLCVVRALPEVSCLFLDMTVDPCEAVLIDERIPRVWHAFKLSSGGDLAVAMAAALKPVLGFHRRLGAAGFGPQSPIVVRADQPLPTNLAGRLQKLTGHPVSDVSQPPRVDPDVRFGPFLTCLGLVMRRTV